MRIIKLNQLKDIELKDDSHCRCFSTCTYIYWLPVVPVVIIGNVGEMSFTAILLKLSRKMKSDSIALPY